MRHAQLRAFHHVAHHAGFSRAAQALGLTQPAVSEQVRKLEQHYDVLLFQREKKQVRLTPAGEGLFKLTKHLFAIEEQIGEYLSETRSAVDGTLRIIADSAHHVTDYLNLFRRSHPGVYISLRTGNTAEILNQIRAFNAEIGIVGAIDPGSELIAIDLGATPITAFSAVGYLPSGSAPQCLDALSRKQLVFREAGSKTRQKVEEAARRLNVTLHPVMEVEGREALREVVAAGNGIGFISEAEFGNDPRLQKIPLAGADITMHEMMVYMPQRKDLRVIRTFVEHVRRMRGRNTS